MFSKKLGWKEHPDDHARIDFGARSGEQSAARLQQAQRVRRRPAICDATKASGAALTFTD
jgi:hypothetical protein